MWPFLKVLNCITTEHDLRLVACGGPSVPCLDDGHSTCFIMCAGPPATCACLARLLSATTTASDLGDAFHRDAGIPRRNSQRLQYPAHGYLVVCRDPITGRARGRACADQDGPW